MGISTLDRSTVQLGDRQATSRRHSSLVAAGRHKLSSLFTLIDWLILTVVLHSEAINQ
jgi:hypothetical protein